MKTICDDGWIKTNRVGVLETLAQDADMLEGAEVLRTSVEEGKPGAIQTLFELDQEFPLFK